MSSEQKSNRFKEAFKEQFNLVGLAGAAALSAALLNPIPLLIGVVAEAAYLLFVPDSKWYESRLSVRFDAAVVERREKLKAEIFPIISRRMQERFSRLENIRTQMTGQPGMEKETWFREVLRKLDYLLEKFLLFSSREAQFRQYLQTVYREVVTGEMGPQSSRDQRPPVIARPQGNNRRSWMPDLNDEPPRRRDVSAGSMPDGPGPAAEKWAHETVASIQKHYDEDVVRIQASHDSEEDLNTQAVLEKRIEVINQRREYVGKIGRILTNLGHQMELLEDSFGLINDQLRARSPEQVLADIEGVVTQTDGMTRLLEELAPYEEMSRRISA